MLQALLGIEQTPQTELIEARSAPLFSSSTYAGEWREWARHEGEELLSISTAWQAVQLISGDLAKLPIQKMVREEDKERNILERPQPSHPTWPLVHDRPTRNMGAFKFWRRFWVSFLIWSNGYIRINRDTFGRPESFTLLESMMVAHSVGAMEDEGYFYRTTNAEWVFIPADDMIHVEDLAIHRQSTVGGNVRNRPMWLIESSLRQMGIDLAIDNYGEAFFRHGGRAGGILELPLAMPKKSRDTVQEGFQKVYENYEAAFKTVILRDGSKFHQAQVTPDDTQLNESRQQNIRMWAQRFNLPPHKLGDDSRTSYNTTEQENKAYYDSSLAPRARALTDELRTKLLMPFERRGGRHFYRHDRSEMTEADLDTRSETATKLWSNGLATRNESRKLVGLNPVDDGNEFMTPMNMNVGETDTEEKPVQDDQEERAALTRPPLLHALAKWLMTADGYAHRQGKSMDPGDFVEWLKDPQSFDRNLFAKIVEPAAFAHARAARLHPVEQFAHALFLATCAEINDKARTGAELIPDTRALELLERVENAGS